MSCDSPPHYLHRLYPLKNALVRSNSLRKRLINKSFHAYKNDLQWLLGQDLPSAVKSYVGGLRDKANVDYLHYQVADAKTDTSPNQTIHVHQQVEGNNNTIVRYQSVEASAHLENNQNGVADGSNKRKYTHEEDISVGAKKSRDGDSKVGIVICVVYCTELYYGAWRRH
ncbi:hypothetical protein VTP01DRAFT_10456 [Rhizomucor pusillus]|uniref:uncharacterized protein n=1 Tax=Rhizomucor pusillus TaxID=4840 RepID=UPI003742C9D2